MKKGILFADIDGTLCFHKKQHGVYKLKDNSDGTVEVFDPKNKSKHTAIDISTSLYEVYYDLETRDLCRKVHDQYDFVLVTGGRTSTWDRRKEAMDFADAVILENGGMILDKNGEVDQEWAAKIQPAVPYIQDLIQKLKGEGWKLDIKDRTAMIRIKPSDNGKTYDEVKVFLENLGLPEEIQTTTNLKYWDIIPASSGKDKAVLYVMEKRGFTREQAIGLGDDDNDICFMELCSQQYVPKSAIPVALEAANAKGWFVSEKHHFQGIQEILREILKQ